MKHRQSVTKLSKFLVYILGRQPDEFGLIPDEDGYVSINNLMKALREEPGWRHVRVNQVREAVYSSGSPTVEIEKNLIRAVNRSRLFSPDIPITLPKLLYHPVRRRAYPVLLEKGIPAAASPNQITLTDSIAMAQRLGRRIDPSPVILTVNTGMATEQGATIRRFGRALFLSDCLPLGSFSGPPVPKNRPDPKPMDTIKPQDTPKTPGSYYLDLTIDSAAGQSPQKKDRQRKNAWKRDRMRASRNRASGWPDS